MLTEEEVKNKFSKNLIGFIIGWVSVLMNSVPPLLTKIIPLNKSIIK